MGEFHGVDFPAGGAQLGIDFDASVGFVLLEGLFVGGGLDLGERDGGQGRAGRAFFGEALGGGGGFGGLQCEQLSLGFGQVLGLTSLDQSFFELILELLDLLVAGVLGWDEGAGIEGAVFGDAMASLPARRRS